MLKVPRRKKVAVAKPELTPEQQYLVDMLRFGRRHWKPKAGGERRFDTIDLVWLTNIREMVAKRRIPELAAESNAAWSYSGGGDMASYYADQAARQADDKLEHLRLWLALLDEYIKFRSERECVLPGRWK